MKQHSHSLVFFANFAGQVLDFKWVLRLGAISPCLVPCKLERAVDLADVQSDNFGANPDGEIDDENLACYFVEDAAAQRVHSNQFRQANEQDQIGCWKIQRLFALQEAAEFIVIRQDKVSDDALLFYFNDLPHMSEENKIVKSEPE